MQRLDPAFNLWDSVEPYAAQLLRDERGNVVQDLAQQALETAGVACACRSGSTRSSPASRTAPSRSRARALERRVARLERTARRVVSAVLFAALLIAGAVLRADDAVFGTVLMIASVLPLLHALFSGRGAR